ncbi:MAG TPA: hypothetical protein VH309_06585 [Elusimicrobiota bacterium]|jgi:hypothetical protein|nr:hypothetical protein [Elusimicrobiota bacterium]
MRNARGSILLEVLLMSVVASLMCAEILRARLQPALTAAGGVERVSTGLGAQAALNRVTAVWARLGTCQSDPGAGVVCSGPGTGCECSCAVLPAEAGDRAQTLAASETAGECVLTAAGQ